MDSNRSRCRRPDAPQILPVLTPFSDEWSGWSIKGDYLVAPDGARLHRRRVAGLAWRYEMELMRAGYASQQKADAGKRRAGYGPKVKVVVVDLADYRLHGVAAA